MDWLTQYSEALTELVAVAACVAGSDVGSGTVRTPPPPVVRMHTIFAAPMGGPGEAHVRSVLDIQALAVHAALAQAGERDIDAIHTIYRLEHGPGAWQAHARNIGLDSAADRAAYAMERAIFQHLSRCKASGPAAFMLRMDTLRHLAPVAQLDVDAYWDRVERVCASYARRGSFDEIHAQLVSLVDTAPEIRHGGPFGHLCEWWTTHARQVRCSAHTGGTQRRFDSHCSIPVRRDAERCAGELSVHTDTACRVRAEWRDESAQQRIFFLALVKHERLVGPLAFGRRKRCTGGSKHSRYA